MENEDIYDKFIASRPEIERKGKTVPYTSANGYMFTLLNKDGEIGIRLSKEDGQKFMEEHNTTIFKSHGAVMKDYVLVPLEMFDNVGLMSEYLAKSHAHVNSLPPKPTKKKK